MDNKSEIYEKIKSLNQKRSSAEPINSTNYIKHLRTIKQDLESASEKEQISAVEALQILVDHNVLNIRKDVIDLLDAGCINEALQRTILTSVCVHCLKQFLRENDLVWVGKLYSIYKLHKANFSETLQVVISQNVYKELCKDMVLKQLIPFIFDIKKLEKPENLKFLDLALDIASDLSCSELSSEDSQQFMENIVNWVKIISEFREQKFSNWHKLWMFLVRFSGTKLHSTMTSINKLLRVVESAFRNSSDTERMNGYECWKELIRNVSLDHNYITSDKQLKLLLTPLKAKFSKQEIVVLKKFEVYVFLIEKLQKDTVKVLKDFLEFCFGPVSEVTDINKCGLGKTVPALCLRSAKVLLAILGHSHNQHEECLDTTSEISFKAAVLNSNNIVAYSEYVINSVTECSLLLKEIELDQKRHTVLKCLWRSLFNIILEERVGGACFIYVGKTLKRVLQDRNPYSCGLAAIIFQEIISNGNCAKLVVNQLDSILDIVFSVPLNKECYIEVEKLLIILQNVDSAVVKCEIQKMLFNSFVNYKTSETNVDFVAEIWIFFANDSDDYARGGSLDFLMWPVLHSHQIVEKSREVSVYEHYKCQLTPFIEKSDDLQLALFKQFEKSLKNNPLLLGNVLNILTMFQPKTSHKDISDVTLDTLTLMLLIPSTDNTGLHRDSIESYLKKLFDCGLMNNRDQHSVKKMFDCVQQLLKLKRYDILTYLDEAFTSLPESLKLTCSKHLKLDSLTDIFETENDPDAKMKIHKIITALRNAKSSDSKKDLSAVMPLGGRSAKIANLVKRLPSSPAKTDTNHSPLRLFGKDIDTHSPLKPVAGSQLKNPKVTKPNKKITSPAPKKKTSLIDDESNSKFVLINSEVKFDKSKLTEHQKEALGKRREDIPALYQDLSQSVSQGFESNSGVGDVVFKKPDENIEVKPTVLDNVIGEDCLKEQKEEDPKPNVENARVKKIRSELQKLSMNIVGADEFMSPGSKRKRRIKTPNEFEAGEKKKRNSMPSKSLKGSCDNGINDSKSDNHADGALETIENGKTPLSTSKLKPAEAVSADKKGSSAIPATVEGKHTEVFKENLLTEEADIEKPNPDNVAQESIETTAKRKSKNRNKSLPRDASKQDMNPSKKGLTPTKPKLMESFLLKKRTTPVKSSPDWHVTAEDVPAYESQSELFNAESKTQDLTVVKPLQDEHSECPPKTNGQKSEISGNKRKRVSSSEEDDIIESSQDTSVANVSTSKLRWSLKKNKVGKNPEVDSTSTEEKNSKSTKSHRTSSKENSERINAAAVRRSKRCDMKDKRHAKLKRFQEKDQSKANIAEDLENNANVSKEEPVEHGPCSCVYCYTAPASVESKKKRVKHLKISPEASIAERRRSPRNQDDKDKNQTTPVEITKQAALTFSETVDLFTSNQVSKVETQSENQMKRTQSKDTETIGSEPLDDKDKNQITPVEITKQAALTFSETVDLITSDQVSKVEIQSENQMKRTQSQDTETIGSEPLGIEQDVQPILDLPQKLPLTDSEKEVAQMDTASFVESECTVIRPDKTITSSDNQNKIIETEVISEVVECPVEDTIDYPQEMARTETFSENMNQTKINVEVVQSQETNADSSCEILVTEELMTEMAEHNIEVVVENNMSPVKEMRAENCTATPDRLQASLPTSPVTKDTPNRTSEFLSNTSDISPITSSSEEDDQPRKLMPVALKFDCEDDEHPSEQKSPEKGDEVPEKDPEPALERDLKVEEGKSDVSSPKREQEKKDGTTCVESFGHFTFIKQDTIAAHRLFVKRRCGQIMSPSTSRIKKLMSNVKPPSQTESVEEVRKEDILTFSREVPSPLAIPRTSILKRKHPDTTEDSSSPCAKRKRVNFSDPCISSKKLFIKEDSAVVHTVFGAAYGDEIDRQFMEVLKANHLANDIDIPPDADTSSDSSKTQAEKSSEMNDFAELDSKSPLALAEQMVQKIDVKLELTKIMERAKSENIPLDTLCSVVLGSSNKAEVLAWVKMYFRVEITDLLEEEDLPNTVKHIIGSVGFDVVFKALEEISQKDVNTAFDHFLKEKPLSVILETRSVQELGSALWEGSCSFTKQQLLDVCFLPHINSVDLIPFFDKLNVVEVSEIVAKRLSHENYSEFVRRILGLSEAVKESVKETVLNACSVDELTTKVLEKGSHEDIKSSIARMFSTVERVDKLNLLQILMQEWSREEKKELIVHVLKEL